MTRHALHRTVVLVAILIAAIGLVSAPNASAAAGGTVVTGRVVDTAGNPLAGVQVWFSPVDPDALPTHVLGATTAADGRYQALLPTATSYSEVYFDGADATGPTSRGGYVTRYLLATDGSRQVVQPRAGTTVRGANAVLAPGAGVGGRVTERGGRPLAGVLVYLAPTGVLPSENLPYQSIEPAHTAADGTWSLTGLDLGARAAVRTTFEFITFGATGGTSPTGYANACLGLVPAPCERGNQYTGPTPQYFSLAPGKLATGANIVLPPAAELQGRLTTPNGTAIRGATVEVYSPVRTVTGGIPPLTGGVGTANDGTWRERYLLPGYTYAVCYGYRASYVDSGGRDGPTFVPECSHDSPVSADFRAGTLYRPAAGQAVEVDDSLKPNGLVSGRVVNGDGDVIRGASVYVYTPDLDGRRIGPFPSSFTGKYSVRGVPTGPAILCATAPGYPATCPPSRGPVTTVTVTPYLTTTAPDLVLINS